MRFRLARAAAMTLAMLVCISCGQVYRPVVIPITTTPPNPANFHAVFAVSANTAFNAGTAFQIDVSGDSNIGQANVGVNPTHAAILPNNSRVFVATAGANLCAGDTDVVTSFAPAFDSSAGSGLGQSAIFTFPNIGSGGQTATITAISEVANVVTVNLSAPLSSAAAGGSITITNVVISGGGANSLAYNGCFPIYAVSGTVLQYTNPISGLSPASGGTAATPAFCRYLPDYVTTAQTTAVFVANFGAENDPNCSLASTDSIAQLNPSTNTITNIQYLPAGSHPVAMAETPNALNLYVLEQGSNTITDLSPVDLSPITSVPIALGNLPTWIVARPDGQRIYVVTQGDGQLYTIRTDTNAVLSAQPVGGPGANFVLYDTHRNRLYVTNPAAGAVYVFDATTDPPTPVGSATGAVSIPAPPVCAVTMGLCNSTMPVSVTALPDGSRFYVASYATAVAGVPCPDSTVNASQCVIPQVTVFDAAALTVKTTVYPLFTTVNSSSFAAAPVAYCTQAGPSTPYTPSLARFRMFATAASDGSHVYASICDAGTVADILTTTSGITTGGTNTPDTLVSDIVAPFGAGGLGSNGQPLPQSPIFLLTGQ